MTTIAALPSPADEADTSTEAVPGRPPPDHDPHVDLQPRPRHRLTPPQGLRTPLRRPTTSPTAPSGTAPGCETTTSSRPSPRTGALHTTTKGNRAMVKHSPPPSNPSPSPGQPAPPPPPPNPDTSTPPGGGTHRK
ncbi:hypothetical protein OG373_02965 [Streptomyces avidinii]|uniref:hypothetical protein n=1 Tax=Streptomyces avidinii TaxID=1895 RepID=UPI0038632A60|nr:hypothetical protein OG373_02965 [Streptomyces avidinii]